MAVFYCDRSCSESAVELVHLFFGGFVHSTKRRFLNDTARAKMHMKVLQSKSEIGKTLLPEAEWLFKQ